MTVGVKDALTGDQTMEIDATWASSRAANGYTGETVSIAEYNRSFDTYADGDLTGTAGNDALLYETTGSGKRDALGHPVADAHHFVAVGTFDMGLGDDVLDLTSSGGGASSYATRVDAFGDAPMFARFSGAGGDDVIWGGGGRDAIYGDADRLGAGATGGDDVLHGGDGNDIIRGDAESMEEGATAGDDIIDGGTGGDLLIGDSRDLDGITRGHNTFVFDGPGSGQDRIGNSSYGFQQGLDHIRLSAEYGYADGDDVIAHTSDVGGGAVVDLGNGDSIQLRGLITSQLDAGDFIIA